MSDEQKMTQPVVSSQFSHDEVEKDPILQYFDYAHLPTELRKVSMRFADLANYVINSIPRNAERTVALRKLLEAKDAAVRAKV